MKTIIAILLAIGSINLSWAFDWNDLWQTPSQKALRAFRAKDYKKAARLYAKLKDNDYNRGNALAHAGLLEAAIEAYDKALISNPNEKDAIYNRKIVEELLKKQNKQDKQKQKQNDQKQNKMKQNPSNQKNQPNEQNKESQPSKAKSEQSNQKQNSHPTPAEKEQQDAKKQWLKLIPDDPGGLMREKFLRDYLKRQQG